MALLISTILLTAVVRVNRNGIFTAYLEQADGKPGIAALFLGIREGEWNKEEQYLTVMAPVEESEDGNAEEPAEEEEIPAAADIPEEFDESDAKCPVEENTEYQEEPETEMPEAEEPDLPREFVQVEEDYFDDALFIGDSRTVGMYEYGGLEARATFFCRTSLTIYDLFEKDKAFIKVEEEKLTLREALSDQQFGKIYLMLGINELGTGTPETFLASYTAAVEEIRQLQPDAIIFVQGIMGVAAQKSDTDPIFNNKNINVRNERLKTLADDRTVFFVDVNEAVCDEDGNLFDGWTFDQIHLKAKYYEIWKNYLLTHGIVL